MVLWPPLLFSKLGGLGSTLRQTSTQCLKIIEEKGLPLLTSVNGKPFMFSRISTLNRIGRGVNVEGSRTTVYSRTTKYFRLNRTR